MKLAVTGGRGFKEAVKLGWNAARLSCSINGCRERLGRETVVLSSDALLMDDQTRMSNPLITSRRSLESSNGLMNGLPAPEPEYTEMVSVLPTASGRLGPKCIH